MKVPWRQHPWLFVAATLAASGTTLYFASAPRIGVRAPASIAPEPAPRPAPPAADPCADLHRMICSRKSVTRDPTGVVRNDRDAEIRVLRIYENVIRKNPDLPGDAIDEAFVKKVYTPARVKKVKAAFNWAKRAARAFIGRQPLSVLTKGEKRQLLGRIDRVSLELPPPASNYSDEPDLFTKSGVFYERTEADALRIRVGGAYLLAADSWFNLLFTLSHELAHSIDPCELRASGSQPRAYSRLAACFARNGVIAKSKGIGECSERDQLSEAFADWMAVQLQSEALLRYATEFDPSQLRQAIVNSVRDLCDQDESFHEPDMSSHPSPQVRIASIFGRNPNVREILGCSPDAGATRYCSLEETPGSR